MPIVGTQSGTADGRKVAPMTGSPPYTGLYINLDRSIERRRAMEDQLRRFNLADRYERCSAIDAREFASHGQIQPGEATCFHSHYQALMRGANRGSAIHILEDDVLLSQYLGEAARTIVTSNLFGRFDIIFTDTFVHTDVMQLAFYKQAFDHAMSGGPESMKFTVIDLEQRYLASMTSYFVAANSVEKILTVYREELARGPRMPVDFCMRLAAQEGASGPAVGFRSSRACCSSS